MTYQKVIEHLEKEKRTRHLLVGNGFSMAYDKAIFSYNALSTFVSNSQDELLNKLFEIIKTKNFEIIMQQLDNFYLLAKEFSKDEELPSKISSANSKLKEKLIEAVKTMHPEHVFTVPDDKSKSCSEFLNYFVNSDGHIFSTNYDLLLYWVLMRNKEMMPKAIDGFGRPSEDEEDKDIEPDLKWGKYKEEQNIHYLHGTLPIFDTGTTIEKETYSGASYLLENIQKRMEKREYPVFVTAGNGTQKLNHILHNQYLAFCYETLTKIQGSLITFGFKFGEYDEHIIGAVNAAAKYGKKIPDKLWSIYIGVHSEEDKKHIESIEKKFKCKVNLYDAKSVSIWGKS